MIFFAMAVGAMLVFSTLIDAFEVVLLPRPVRRRLRVNRFFFRWAWAAWAWTAARVATGRRREDFLGVFGPLSMVSLFGAWALFLIVGFGLLHWAVQQFGSGGPPLSLPEAMVISGDAFFTLGYGDVVPHHAVARLLVIAEAGTGFGFIALTIAYLPVLYQHFSRRDYQLIELSARAGTPPTAEALIHWHAQASDAGSLVQWLRDWEIWASDLTESHSAYPMLAFYRSQHEGHSWLAALAVIMDTCSLLIAGSANGGQRQAVATFEAARGALTSVATSLEIAQPAYGARAWNPEGPLSVAPVLTAFVDDWQHDAQAANALTRLREIYEPLLDGLSSYLILPLPQGMLATGSAPEAVTREDVVGRLSQGRSGATRTATGPHPR